MPNYNSKTPLEETFDKSNIFSKVDNSNTELSFTQPERTIPDEVVPNTTTKEKKKQSCDFCVICNLRPDLLVWDRSGYQQFRHGVFQKCF